MRPIKTPFFGTLPISRRPVLLRPFFRLLLILLLSVPVLQEAEALAADRQRASRNVSGVVYHDLNRNGVRDLNEPGIAGVMVSNGEQIVRTDSEGRYRLRLRADNHLFVIKPGDWMTPTDKNGIPRFYYFWSPDGVSGKNYEGAPPTGSIPKSVDFPLFHQPEPDRYRVLVFGDTQPRDLREIHYIARDVVQEVTDADALFGITLGDLVFDDLDLFEPLNDVIGTIGIPWRHVIGNHDIDYSAETYEDARGAYYRTYGPSWYAFSVGSTHFLVVDGVRFPTSDPQARYRTGIGERQLNFIENFLQMIPQEERVFLLTHIPFAFSTGWEKSEERDRLFSLLSARPHTVTLSAHAHRHYHRFLGPEEGWPGEEPHHLVSMGTTGGGWWSGAPDEYGIPHSMMMDGTPTGYAWLDIDGTEWKLTYKAARRPADFQMHIHLPDPVPATSSGPIEVHVNIFNALPDAVVEMQAGGKGEWMPLQRREVNDLFLEELKQREEALGDGIPWRPSVNPYPSAHIWTGELPEVPEAGAHLIRIRAKDRWHHYEGRRILLVTEEDPEP